MAVGRSRLLMSLARSAKEKGCPMKQCKSGVRHRKEAEKLGDIPATYKWPRGDLRLLEEVASG